MTYKVRQVASARVIVSVSAVPDNAQQCKEVKSD
jgi:hypothetical protein